ncbi:DASH complex subunit Dad1-domain-containing protein [Pholiota molesta]|nr:DASH complex subunit Dad1-domain-containing protein [Pholiota molesta]
MSHHDEDASFFDRERDRLSREITSGFEELLSSTNGLNRKLEEVLGMTKEYDTIASLWHSFYQLMRNSGKEDTEEAEEEQGGLPGTGSHVVASKQSGGPSSRNE